MWDELTYPFPNFNRTTVEVGMLSSHVHLTGQVITYPCWDHIKSVLVKLVPGNKSTDKGQYQWQISCEIGEALQVMSCQELKILFHKKKLPDDRRKIFWSLKHMTIKTPGIVSILITEGALADIVTGTTNVRPPTSSRERIPLYQMRLLPQTFMGCDYPPLP